MAMVDCCVDYHIDTSALINGHYDQLLFYPIQMPWLTRHPLLQWHACLWTQALSHVKTMLIVAFIHPHRLLLSHRKCCWCAEDPHVLWKTASRHCSLLFVSRPPQLQRRLCAMVDLQHVKSAVKASPNL